MSGPIVRKYGFPNFEKIFGERELKHGGDVEPTAPPATSTPESPGKLHENPDPTKAEAEAEADRPKT